MRKSSRRSDQRRPPRATEPPRRCTPSTRGECTKISKRGRGSGVSGDLRRVELERHVRLRAGQEVVRAQHRAHDRQEAAQDPVLVEAVDGVDRLLDLARDVLGPPAVAGRDRSARGTAPRARAATPAMREQRVLHVAVAERDPGLAQVARDGAQHRHLAPVEPGADDQAVEAVLLGLAAPHAREALVEALADRVDVDRRPTPAGRSRRSTPARSSRGVTRYGRSSVTVEAEALEHRQHVGQRHALAAAVELAAQRPRAAPRAAGRG